VQERPGREARAVLLGVTVAAEMTRRARRVCVDVALLAESGSPLPLLLRREGPGRLSSKRGERARESAAAGRHKGASGGEPGDHLHTFREIRVWVEERETASVHQHRGAVYKQLTSIWRRFASIG